MRHAMSASWASLEFKQHQKVAPAAVAEPALLELDAAELVLHADTVERREVFLVE